MPQLAKETNIQHLTYITLDKFTALRNLKNNEVIIIKLANKRRTIVIPNKDRDEISIFLKSLKILKLHFSKHQYQVGFQRNKSEYWRKTLIPANMNT